MATKINGKELLKRGFKKQPLGHYSIGFLIEITVLENSSIVWIYPTVGIELPHIKTMEQIEDLYFILSNKKLPTT